MRFRYIAKVIVIILLFIGSNIIGVMGVSSNTFNAFMIGLALIPLVFNSHDWSQNRYSTYLVLFVISFALFKIFTDKGEGTRVLSMTIIGAPILYLCIPNAGRPLAYRNILLWKSIAKLVLLAFLTNSVIAYAERLFGYNFFGVDGTSIMEIADSGQASFRSAAIYGHPLKNSLLTSTAIGFVLISSLKPQYKFFLWICGYIAILCFNTRGSIVGEILMLMIYVLYFLSTTRKKTNIKSLVFFLSIVVSVIAYILLVYGGLGGRLIENGLDDDSSMVRITIWDVFENHSVIDFLFGINHSSVDFMMYSVGVQIIENFWLVYLFRFGLIFLLLYVFVYFLFLKSLFSQYKLFDKLFVTANFLLIASTNNSLSSGFMTLWYFLLLIAIFNPCSFKYIVPRSWII